jgi:hypothetical protein
MGGEVRNAIAEIADASGPSTGSAGRRLSYRRWRGRMIVISMEAVQKEAKNLARVLLCGERSPRVAVGTEGKDSERVVNEKKIKPGWQHGQVCRG